MAKHGAPSLKADALFLLKKRGVESYVLDARMEWAATDTFRRYVKPLEHAIRAYPNYLPTQASGRWSITEPPLTNFPDDSKADELRLPKLQGVVWPDVGTYWACSDWNAMHAVFMAAVSDDTEDLEAFTKGLDIHTITCCRMFKLPLPPNLMNPHTSPECEGWRVSVGWKGKGDRRRHLGKTTRFSLLNAWDEKGVLEAKGVLKLGLTPDDLLDAGRKFLKAKPNMVAWKANYAADAIAKGEARSLMGRRRKLFGSNNPEQYREKYKTAVSHFLQGSEVDIMETCILEVHARFPEVRLAWPSHDGLKFVFPQSIPVDIAYPALKEIIERPRLIGKHTVPLAATWEVIREGGMHVKL